MKNKIIITESQLENLKVKLLENTAYSIMVKRIKEELDSNYQVVDKFVKEGGEYHSQPMFMIKVDEEVITAKDLYEYMKYKHKVSEEFIKQVIRDWVDNKIDDNYILSKHVPLK